jgi:hypothetical protein
MRNFILDTDWWTDCDDAVAIRLLCNAHLLKKVNLLGININACMDDSIPSLDVFTRDCGVEIPLGIDHSAVNFAGNPPYQKNLAARNPEHFNKDAPDSIEFYLQLLEQSEDNSVEFLSIGFTQCLASLLKNPQHKALLQKKASHLWIMAGKWDEENGKEYNFYKNEMTRASGAELCKNWPTPITFLGYEVGVTVITGGNLPDGDLLKQVMIDHNSAKGRCSWDPMLVDLAIIGDTDKAGYNTVYGYASVDPADGSNTFTVAETGQHRYVVKKYADSFYAEAIDSQLVLK